MSLLIQYLVKLSICLSIVWLFYQLILRRLTFYNSNRWYLLGYTILSFLIPFINISPIIKSNNGSENGIIQLIPSVNQYTIALEEASHCPVPIWSTGYDKWDWTAFALMIGAGILLLRFLVRYISFIRIRNGSKLISSDGIKIYQVDDNIIPFSFGKSVFINPNLHTEDELREIVRHEFVHIRQNHTIDIIWAELLSIINWYNPFAWLLKRSIRQNLEFIADNKVVENGIDKKQYQYLLLKVIGDSQFCIATQFNFSSLKKRIAMMNKTKSAKRQLLRMLFLLPATAILLLAFRNKLNESSSDSAKSERVYNNLPVANIAIKQQEIISDTIPSDNPPKDYNEFLKRNPQIKNIQWSGDPFSMTINLKDGSKETYNVENKKEIASLKKKYGKLPPGPPLGPGSEKEIEVTEESSREVEELAEVKVVTVKEVPAKVVNAELAEVTVIGTPSKKAVSATGEIKEVTLVAKPAKAITTNAELQEAVVSGVPSKKAISTTGELKEVTVVGKPATTITTNPDFNEVTAVGKPSKASTTVKSNVVSETSVAGTTIASTDQTMIGDVDITITIKNTAKPEDLESFISKLKDKGYELKFDNKAYNDGILKKLSGTIKYKDSSSTFSFTDFDQATIIVYRDGDQVNFKIYTGKRKVTS